MRIWSLHPKYLDSKGIVALWRETLLAQNVLLGKTKGYKNHPQLERFKAEIDAIGAIGRYLKGVYEESVRRGYNFDRTKIVSEGDLAGKITVTRGQLAYELEHLKRKLETRDPLKYVEIAGVETAETHELFKAVEGDIEEWERI